ncbi:MAG: NAD-dependent epimerase/dehydratase family protein [Kiritimatiellae bacterium]|jgi:nucleoside-diphosphate-sugar epimerase|nr:NAD-dependent epimerase/dehydratase family protein [Kiritimatiellia bacterium]NLD89927.1 NAD-dependent epimerase/dehydratase family protein [Lentisphaerota bacterium]HPC18673.1 NAD-dependent epimerase/dehydratase family protein [Kiritimatiellia bacterium]HQN80173.1 NAD-dependent epimerase/dehydratase family protein [Kiritimatiellia bacterium]HQQ61616.1 NAD-dependent epimerase/dehydratase family protein [Kiritimatiellia bacterium]
MDATGQGRVLVTGGSGFLGINLIRHLLAKGVKEIRSLDLVEFDYPEKDRIEALKGDIRDDAMVAKAMEGVRQVVHTAAALPLYSPEDIHTTDVVGTRILLEAALKAGVDRFVMISSTAVYGIPDHHPLLEDDELIGVGPYGRAKIEAEVECLKAREQGLCVPIIRPKSFIGPERLGVFAMLYDWAHTGHGFPMIGNGRNRYQLLDVEDLCEAIWRTMTMDKATVNDIFNIGAKEYTTMGEDYQAVLDDAGHGKKVRGFPAAPMIWTLRFLELLKLSPLYKWVYETASKDSFVGIEKAEKVLNFTPRYSNKEALVRNYRWYVEHLDQFKNANGVSHRVPWKQGILGLAKHFF